MNKDVCWETSRGRGFSLIEIIVVLILIVVLGLAGINFFKTTIDNYLIARNSYAVAQKAQAALNRMTLDLSYAAGSSLSMTGITVTDGTAPAIRYTAAIPSGSSTVSETHTIFQSGTALYYGDTTMTVANANILTDEVNASGITFSFYNTYSDASPSTPSSSTTMVGISLTMHGANWPAGSTKVLVSRVMLNKTGN